MARYTGPKAKISRRFSEPIMGESKALQKKNYAPGQHGKGGRIKSKVQGYGLQLREKQKTKRLYGMVEGQFRLFFDRATQEKGVSGENLLSSLERRLDNVIYRLGFGGSRAQARQLVRHGHVRVNDRRLDVPSFQVRVGDSIALSAAAGKNALVTAAVDSVKGRGVPKWLELDASAMKGKVVALPARDDVNFPIQEQLIVELYSK